MTERSWVEKNFTGTVVRVWQDFLDTLNSDGGHIALLLALVLSSSRIAVLGNHVELWAGALLGYLKSAGSNKTRRDRPVPETEKTVKTTATETMKEKEVPA